MSLHFKSKYFWNIPSEIQIHYSNFVTPVTTWMLLKIVNMSDDFMKVCEWFPLKLDKIIIGLARLSNAGSWNLLNLKMKKLSYNIKLFWP